MWPILDLPGRPEVPMPRRLSRPLATLLRSITDLPPSQITRAEEALRTARRRAEAVVEIDAVGEDRACPSCGGLDGSRWGRTRAGAQRWRCKGCGRSWTGRTGTPLAGVHRPGLFIEVARNMLDPMETPLSCRKLGSRLGLSRDTVWRWRMLVLTQLRSVSLPALSGIVEADDTAQRESRKGSREWVRHERDPSQPRPPRKRWHEYPKGRPPQKIHKKWSEAILGVVDREGRANFAHTGNIGQATLHAVLAPQVAPDAMVSVRRGAAIPSRRKGEGPVSQRARRGPSWGTDAAGLPPQHRQCAARPVEGDPHDLARPGDQVSRWLRAVARRPAGWRSRCRVPRDACLIGMVPTRFSDIPAETICSNST